MSAPDSPRDWAGLLRRDWETRSRLPSRDLFVASHPGWDDPAVRERYAREELDLFLMDLGEERLRRADVLEIGCGSGRLAPLLASRVKSYTGFDIAAGMVEAARAGCAGLDRVRFFLGDGLAVPEPARDRVYSIVLAVAVFIHCPREVIAANLRSAWEWLAPGGQIRFQLLADPRDRDGLALPAQTVAASTEVVARDSREVIARLTEEEHRLVFDTYYMGDAFTFAEVAPFVFKQTGGRVALYRGDLRSIYGLVEKPPEEAGGGGIGGEGGR